jgi:hypothetical protein
LLQLKKEKLARLIEISYFGRSVPFKGFRIVSLYTLQVIQGC